MGLALPWIRFRKKRVGNWNKEDFTSASACERRAPQTGRTYVGSNGRLSSGDQLRRLLEPLQGTAYLQSGVVSMGGNR